jgi:hypothetical protein
MAVSLRFDVNNDGMMDPLISTTGFWGGSGRLFYIPGGAEMSSTTLSNYGSDFHLTGSGNGQLGAAMASGGDVDKDSIPDMIVGGMPTILLSL